MILTPNKINALEIIKLKIHTVESLLKTIAVWRLKNNKIVFTNGCFDILHLGHLDYLSKAADLGGRLIIGLNSDASIKKLNKGENRPIQDEQSRLLILSALQFVDAVILFNEDTPEQLIKLLQPDVLVKGADYDSNETNQNHKNYISGSYTVKASGGEVKTIPFLEGFSTTKIENKIKGKGF